MRSGCSSWQQFYAMRRIKASQVAPLTQVLLKSQGGKCPLCGLPIGPRAKKTPALDHDHDTGYIRDVLCINCNGIEGKIRNLFRRMGVHMTKLEAAARLVAYWERHQVPKHNGIFHHTHRTPEEKRLERLAKAAARRKKAKA